MSDNEGHTWKLVDVDWGAHYECDRCSSTVVVYSPPMPDHLVKYPRGLLLGSMTPVEVRAYHEEFKRDFPKGAQCQQIIDWANKRAEKT